MRKKKCFIFLLIILLFGVICLAFFSSHQKIYNTEKDERLQKQVEDYAEKQQKEKYLYPQDEKGNGISINYTIEVLSKVARGIELSKSDNELIMYHKIQEDGLGYAVTKYYENDGGMGKASRRTWRTSDNGEKWDVVKEEFYSTGNYSWVLMDAVLIESGFGVMTMKGYFKISNDLGSTFEEIPYSEIYEYEGLAYPELVNQNEARKSITYRWVDYHTQEELSTIDYSLQLDEQKRLEERK